MKDVLDSALYCDTLQLTPLMIPATNALYLVLKSTIKHSRVTSWAGLHTGDCIAIAMCSKALKRARYSCKHTPTCASHT